MPGEHTQKRETREDRERPEDSARGLDLLSALEPNERFGSSALRLLRTKPLWAALALHLGAAAAVDPDGAKTVAHKAEWIRDRTVRGIVRTLAARHDPAFEAEIQRRIESGEVERIDLGEYFLRQEFLENGFSQEEYEEARRTLRGLIERFKERARRDPDTHRLLHDMVQEQGRYSKPRSTLTDLLLRREGNCDARTKLMLVLLQHVRPDLPVEIERFKKHVRALVLVDGVTLALEKPFPKPVSAEKRERTETLDASAYILAWLRQRHGRSRTSAGAGGARTDASIDLTYVGTKSDLPEYSDGPTPDEEAEDVRLGYEEARAERLATEGIRAFTVRSEPTPPKPGITPYIEVVEEEDPEASEQARPDIEALLTDKTFRQSLMKELNAYAFRHGFPELHHDYMRFLQAGGTPTIERQGQRIIEPYIEVFGLTPGSGKDRALRVDAAVMLASRPTEIVSGTTAEDIVFRRLPGGELGHGMQHVTATLHIPVPEKLRPGRRYSLSTSEAISLPDSFADGTIMTSIIDRADQREDARGQIRALLDRPDVRRRVAAGLLGALRAGRLQYFTDTYWRAATAAPPQRYEGGRPQVSLAIVSVRADASRHLTIWLNADVEGSPKRDFGIPITIDVVAPSSTPADMEYEPVPSPAHAAARTDAWSSPIPLPDLSAELFLAVGKEKPRRTPAPVLRVDAQGMREE